MDVRTPANIFADALIAAMTEAAAAAPNLEELFPGSLNAALEEAQTRIDGLVTFLENTATGWAEAVETASPLTPAAE